MTVVTLGKKPPLPQPPPEWCREEQWTPAATCQWCYRARRRRPFGSQTKCLSMSQSRSPLVWGCHFPCQFRVKLAKPSKNKTHILASTTASSNPRKSHHNCIKGRQEGWADKRRLYPFERERYRLLPNHLPVKRCFEIGTYASINRIFIESKLTLSYLVWFREQKFQVAPLPIHH